VSRAGILIAVLIHLVEYQLGFDRVVEGRSIDSLANFAFFETSAVFLGCNLMFTPVRDARDSLDPLLEITC
jgi:hypothetical protein